MHRAPGRALLLPAEAAGFHTWAKPLPPVVFVAPFSKQKAMPSGSAETSIARSLLGVGRFAEVLFLFYYVSRAL
jgi:hypothetical protein